MNGWRECEVCGASIYWSDRFWYDPEGWAGTTLLIGGESVWHNHRVTIPRIVRDAVEARTVAVLEMR